jgi:hypothetical protein
MLVIMELWPMRCPPSHPSQEALASSFENFLDLKLESDWHLALKTIKIEVSIHLIGHSSIITNINS